MTDQYFYLIPFKYPNQTNNNYCQWQTNSSKDLIYSYNNIVIIIF